MAVRMKGIDAVYYLAKNFPRAVAFYETCLELEPVLRADNFVEFRLPDGSAFGIGFQDGYWYQGGGVLFATDDINEAIERLESYGITAIGGVGHIVWSEDTEGNVFGLYQR